MAEEFDAVSVDQLDTITLALEQYLSVANVNGKLYKSRIGDLVTFITPFLSGVNATGLVFPDASNVLPNPNATVKGSIVGAGTFTWTGGSLVTTGLLNIIATNGTAWYLVKAIPTGDLLSKTEYNFGGAYPTLAAANAAIANTVVNGKNLRDGKRVDIGTTGSYVPHWWKGGFDNTNLAPVVSFTDLYIYEDTPNTVKVVKTSTGVNIIIDAATPVVFNDNPLGYGLIQTGTYSIPTAHYAYLSTNATVYTRPTKVAAATPLYIMHMSFLDTGLPINPVLIGVTAGTGGFVSPHWVLNLNSRLATDAIAGMDIIVYEQLPNSINVNRTAQGADIVITTAAPVIFNKNPTNYGLIEVGTYSIPTGHYAYLSTNPTTYTRPPSNLVGGTKLYIMHLNFIDLSLPVNPVILGIVAGTEGFISPHWILNSNSREASTAAQSQIRGLKLGVEGDSIMEQDRVTTNIRLRTGCTTVITAKSGSGFVMNVNGTIRSRIAVLANPSNNLAALMIAGATNDYGNNIPLGSATVLNDDTTFHSAVYNTFRVLRVTNPTVPVLISIPIQRYYHPTNETRGSLNTIGLSLLDYIAVIRKYAQMFGFPVCDLYSTSQITLENIDNYTSDGVHPNDAGAKIMGGLLTAEINRLIIN